MSKISTLPNYCNGKLYKRWDRVTNIFGEKTILATKKSGNGETVELLISADGKRELYTDRCKIMDITGDDNIKRTYSYRRTKDGIEGKMVSDTSGEAQPLITSAKWFIKNFVPQEVNLSLNTMHPRAKINLPKAISNKDVTATRPVIVKNVTASGFSDGLKIVPSKLKFTTENGNSVITDSPETGNIFISNTKGVKAENHPMQYINVVV